MPPEEQVVTPETPAEGAVPVVEQEVTPPTTPVTQPPVSQQPDTSRELDWLRQQYSNATQRLEQLQTELSEYETAAMTEEEIAAYNLQQQQEGLTQQQQRLAEMMYAQDLWSYYQGFVPANVIKGNDPSEWQDNVLRHLANENTRLKAEVATLRAGVKPGAGAPKVSTPAGVPGKKTIWDYTQAEREVLFQKAQDGLMRPEDYPPTE